jgi:hypothetical protein
VFHKYLLIKCFAGLSDRCLVFEEHVSVLIILLSLIDISSDNLSAFRGLCVLHSADRPEPDFLDNKAFSHEELFELLRGGVNGDITYEGGSLIPVSNLYS